GPPDGLQQVRRPAVQRRRPSGSPADQLHLQSRLRDLVQPVQHADHPHAGLRQGRSRDLRRHLLQVDGAAEPAGTEGTGARRQDPGLRQGAGAVRCAARHEYRHRQRRHDAAGMERRGRDPRSRGLPRRDRPGAAADLRGRAVRRHAVNRHAMAATRRCSLGWSLVELSVVLAVLGLLGLVLWRLLPLAPKVAESGAADRELAAAGQALVGYALAHNGLPPPLVVDGQEMLPTEVLGLPSTLRLRYQVLPALAATPDELFSPTLPPAYAGGVETTS